jgi:hypothetical protein
MGELKREVWEKCGVVMDATYFPVVINVLPAEFPNDGDFLDAWFARSTALCRAHASPFVSIVDCLAVQSPADARSRKLVANWVSTDAAFRMYCIGLVIIIGGSSLVRGTITAFNWLLRPQPRRAIVTDWSEALPEARRKLDAVGVAWPAAAERYASRAEKGVRP